MEVVLWHFLSSIAIYPYPSRTAMSRAPTTVTTNSSDRGLARSAKTVWSLPRRDDDDPSHCDLRSDVTTR